MLALPGVPNLYKHHPSGGSTLASGSFPWRKNGKKAVDLSMGLALQCFKKLILSKGGDLMERYPRQQGILFMSHKCDTLLMRTQVIQ